MDGMGSGARLSAAVGLVLVATLVVSASATPERSSATAGIRVTDLGLKTLFQDHYFGHFKRGRADVAADFDLDGRVDFFIGNPGDESMVLRNLLGNGGKPTFRGGQVLLTDELAWGAVAFDYDNDGDYDLFVTVGGNEDTGFNKLFRNLWLESGGMQLTFEDVTDGAGVAGPTPPGFTDPIPIANANALVADYDRDGWDDVFVNVGILDSSLAELKGRNLLWHNEGDGTFTDVTDQVGLGATQRNTRISTFFDIDNDGDVDLYENNFGGRNVLWRNRLAEDGVATFEDVTAAFSPAGEDLSCPLLSFDSAAADFDNDGWEDLLLFVDLGVHSTPDRGLACPYPDGHVLFHNLGGTGFENVADTAEINNPFQTDRGVMGCQVGDVTGDGVSDVYIGNGAPVAGQYDQFFVADSAVGEPIHFANQTALIDFPAPEGQGVVYPPYPYRTHGTAFVDVDNDGSLEIAVVNGGPASWPDDVQEPNRLFKLTQTTPPKWLEVRPLGNGVTVARDAVGTRFGLTVSQGGGAPWTIHRTLFAGSCFSAQNGFMVHFGLGQADTVQRLDITWPDGSVETITSGISVNTCIEVQQASSRHRSPGRTGR
jgi:enediyne biosynthesis protein E4